MVPGTFFRSRNKPAAAIGTDISHNLFDTGRAEHAFIRANPSLYRLRRQRLIAMFASRSEFKHGALFQVLVGQDMYSEQTHNHRLDSYVAEDLRHAAATRTVAFRFQEELE